MSILTDPLNLLLIVVAAIAGFKLWQVLGQRTGFERPPLQPQFQTAPKPTDLELKAVEGKPRKIWEGFAEEGSAVAAGLAAIAARDPAYDTAEFIAGAKSAHERILNAFAQGDISTLQTLLAEEPLKAFKTEIQRRAKAGEKAAFKFVSNNAARIVEANLSGERATIEVAFTSEIVSALKNAEGAIVSGDDKRIIEVKELWSFTRDLQAAKPSWQLAETHDFE